MNSISQLSIRRPVRGIHRRQRAGGTRAGTGTERNSPVCPNVSPVEFKLLFTASERIAIAQARAEDPVIDDFYFIVDDPRLTHVALAWKSAQDGIDYIISKGLVAPERREEILTGTFR